MKSNSALFTSFLATTFYRKTMSFHMIVTIFIAVFPHFLVYHIFALWFCHRLLQSNLTNIMICAACICTPHCNNQYKFLQVLLRVFMVEPPGTAPGSCIAFELLQRYSVFILPFNSKVNIFSINSVGFPSKTCIHFFNV